MLNEKRPSASMDYRAQRARASRGRTARSGHALRAGEPRASRSEHSLRAGEPRASRSEHTLRAKNRAARRALACYESRRGWPRFRAPPGKVSERRVHLAWAFERLGTHREVFDLPLTEMTPAAFKRAMAM